MPSTSIKLYAKALTLREQVDSDDGVSNGVAHIARVQPIVLLPHFSNGDGGCVVAADAGPEGRAVEAPGVGAGLRAGAGADLDARRLAQRAAFPRVLSRLGDGAVCGKRVWNEDILTQ